MLTEYEAVILREDFRRAHEAARHMPVTAMRDGPMWRLAAACKFVAGVLIIAGLAVIGATSDLQSQAAADLAAASFQTRGAAPAAEGAPFAQMEEQASFGRSDATPVADASVRAEHHRKAVFDERRRTWEARK
jgi:hypothetical protein